MPRLPGIGDCALICLKVHVDRALQWQGFYVRARPGTIERHAIKQGGLPKWDGSAKPQRGIAEDSPLCTKRPRKSKNSTSKVDTRPLPALHHPPFPWDQTCH